MSDVPADIRAYHDRLDAEARPICDILLSLIDEGLPDADRKVWHAHPVWFFDGNPVVGYDRLTASVRLMFWSGRAFDEPGLSPEGSFEAAEVRYTAPEQIDDDAVRRWLGEAREKQWNYRDIRTNRGLVPLRGVG
ncbi:DUF1801 domain-containing protein [Microbacterium sp. EYE_5]|uniref:DUF1801 domain-containing protein n=1 Tax=unclassified Microbacterium TaxID=2609290 RepID=UPI0020050146|nr:MULTISPECIES: DUF1801 domain-containing protein [unclassified Microbacterium]MCK6081328.1 DUF1801 domain-containing protein [Microbacterium sp. EYE_382]MCK6086598.1 DUF1801 domain-containing protein [Microbacterium sp. EYE_384]MCK6123904.1 DUF1801 domain-containing protein [Microbacterium sp. EYE_80]MCK6126813.1 DUF1801 domain-containing protein [Microbacterium sp. EYE_79]MCK6142283.1 DUF1801 domain-containing protein [Microbacterium sp. EYE_39]